MKGAADAVLAKAHDVGDQMEFLGAALDSCGPELVHNVDALHYTEWDHRRVTLGGD